MDFLNSRVAFCAPNKYNNRSLDLSNLQIISYMSNTLLFFLILAILGGMVHGFSEINNVRQNPSLGVKPSKNLFTFLFTDKY